jgi:putative FmdB family regulatory protein
VPTYEYACTECGDRLEAVQSFTDDALTMCPVCGGRLRKVFGSVGVVFKGSGFYRNDSREKVGAGKGAKGADGEKGSDAGKGSEGDKPAKPASAAASSDGSSAKGSSGGEGRKDREAKPVPARSGPSKSDSSSTAGAA